MQLYHRSLPCNYCSFQYSSTLNTDSWLNGLSQYDSSCYFGILTEGLGVAVQFYSPHSPKIKGLVSSYLSCLQDQIIFWPLLWTTNPNLHHVFRHRPYNYALQACLHNYGPLHPHLPTIGCRTAMLRPRFSPNHLPSMPQSLSISNLRLLLRGTRYLPFLRPLYVWGSEGFTRAPESRRLYGPSIGRF